MIVRFFACVCKINVWPRVWVKRFAAFFVENFQIGCYVACWGYCDLEFLQEIIKHLMVFFFAAFRFFCMVGSPFVMVGIDFASLVHPCLVFLCKKSLNTWRRFLLLFVFYLLVSGLPAVIKRKSGNNFHCFLISCGEGGIMDQFLQYSYPVYMCF